MRVLLIGAGRYGNGLIGRKYMNGELGVKLNGVVDTRIDELKKSSSYLLKGIPVYHSVEEVPKECIQNSINEIALIPQIVPNVLKFLADQGAKQIILPKPVATNMRDYQEITDITTEKGIQALIASNWHYSGITKMLKAILCKATGKEFDTSQIGADFSEKLSTVEGGFNIDSVEVEYNKQNEVLTIDPPMQELPHALQIVYSTGLTNLSKIKPILDKLFQSKSRVNVKLDGAEGIKEGISLNSDLVMGEKLNKKRERLVKIFLSKDDANAIITADYDAFFDENGLCKKFPFIQYEFFKGSQKIQWIYHIAEDNMNVMYNSMFRFFQGSKNDALTVEKYSPIAKCLSKVQSIWEKIVKK